MQELLAKYKIIPWKLPGIPSTTNQTIGKMKRNWIAKENSQEE
jgi:hypothetical protein